MSYIDKAEARHRVLELLPDKQCRLLVILEDVELGSVSNSNDGCCVADSPGEAGRSGRAVQTVGTSHVSAIIRNSVKPGCCRRVITQKNMTAPTKLAVF